MKKRPTNLTLALAALGLGLALAACDGGVRTPGNGGGGDDARNIMLVDAGPGGTTADQGRFPAPDTLAQTFDTGTPLPQPDTLQPDTQPQQPAGPTPPFGSSVGMTAANFTVPDCSDSPVTLHDFYNKGKAVIVMLNKGS
ncbi:MAG: hypothetical protein KC503_47645 [Myxococcales bacterium]|nr:hypothetical protein [Myxococcales bacterium]